MKIDLLSWLRQHWGLTLACAAAGLYTGYVTWLFFAWLEVDTVSYFKVAEYYASFQLDKATNAYWSPMLSWLLVPAFWLQIDVTLWLRLLHVVITGVIIGGVAWGVRRSDRQIPEWLSALVVASVGVTVAFWSAKSSTPDMLLAFGVLVAIWQSGAVIWRPRVVRGVLLGGAWASLFLIKSIGFFVGLALLASLLAVAYRAGQFRTAAKALTAAALVFLGISSAWGMVVYAKYGVDPISIVTSNNISLVGPGANNYHQIDYLNTVLPLPYDDSVTAWDDPAILPPEPGLPTSNPAHYAKGIGHNIAEIGRIFLTYSPLMVLGVVSMALGRRNDKAKLWGVSALFVAGTVVAVYGLLFVAERYLYIVFTPVVTLGVICLSRLDVRRRLHLAGVATLCVAALGVVAMKTVSMQTSAHYMRELRASQQAGKLVVPADSRVAVQSLELMPHCYYLGVQCPALNYKLTGDRQGDTSAIQDLRDTRVSFYITRTPIYHDELILLSSYRTPQPRACYFTQGQLKYDCGSASVLYYEIKPH